MVRGNGSAGVETDVKATARPKTMRITMRRGPLHDTLDNNLSTITITAFFVRDARGMERKEVVDQTFRALSRQLLMASASNGFLSRHTAPMASALASSPGSASAVVMITGKPEDRKSVV